MSDQRVPLLRAALGFLRIPPHERELRLLHRYADTWRGIGDIVAGMAQEYDLELRRTTGEGFEHSLTAHVGAAWVRSPWEAVQRAAGDALYKLEAGEPAPRDWTVTDESPARRSSVRGVRGDVAA